MRAWNCQRDQTVAFQTRLWRSASRHGTATATKNHGIGHFISDRANRPLRPVIVP